ncbi:hypothetical protein Dimus_020798, partial [Dionaea muscipula]
RCQSERRIWVMSKSDGTTVQGDDDKFEGDTRKATTRRQWWLDDGGWMIASIAAWCSDLCSSGQQWRMESKNEEEKRRE